MALPPAARWPVYEALSLALFAGLAFPLVRRLTAGVTALARPRWALWLATAAIAQVVTYAIAYALLDAAMPVLPDPVGLFALRSPLYLFFAFAATLLVPVGVWQTGLVCGARSPGLRETWSRTWRYRQGAFAGALALYLGDFFTGELLYARLAGLPEVLALALSMAPYALFVTATVLWFLAVWLATEREDVPPARAFA